MIDRKIITSIAALATISCAPQTVEVTILPTSYILENIKSETASPVVDEIVRRKPREVHIHICLSTPPKRLVQFETELEARHKTKKDTIFYGKGVLTSAKSQTAPSAARAPNIQAILNIDIGKPLTHGSSTYFDHPGGINGRIFYDYY